MKMGPGGRQPFPSFSTILQSESLHIPVTMRIPSVQLEPLNVLVFGPTGVGKSTIINLLTNNSAQLSVGTTLESCTRSITSASVLHKERTINFFDTPGFDDSDTTPTEHLILLSVSLAEMYKSTERRPNIHCVLYVHRITDNRMAGSSLTSLRVFKELIGPHVFKNLVFVTNRWSDPPVPAHIRFEHQLLHDDRYFGRAIKAGAKGGADYRILEQPASSQAQKLLLDLFVEFNDPKVLQIQQDLIDRNNAIGDSNAGRVVVEESNRSIESIRKNMENLRQERSESKDDEAKKEIEGEMAGLVRRLADAEEQRGLLRYTISQIRNHPVLAAGVGVAGVAVAGVAVTGVAGLGAAGAAGAAEMAKVAGAAGALVQDFYKRRHGLGPK
ncbi:unnamed protein product [Rhizoctonia solani]|uniref:G domain-containing protein n=1 Tax=Rhizoctonia solani TaxID=456999 RepID=A0A8H3D6C5_9AGAM|nr:unnamed protein product [Rhizoctonia solani]